MVTNFLSFPLSENVFIFPLNVPFPERQFHWIHSGLKVLQSICSKKSHGVVQPQATARWLPLEARKMQGKKLLSLMGHSPADSLMCYYSLLPSRRGAGGSFPPGRDRSSNPYSTLSDTTSVQWFLIEVWQGSKSTLHIPILLAGWE